MIEYRCMIAFDIDGREIRREWVPTGEVLGKLRGWWHNLQGCRVWIGDETRREDIPTRQMPYIVFVRRGETMAAGTWINIGAGRFWLPAGATVTIPLPNGDKLIVKG